MRKYFDGKYKFSEVFDDKTGFYARSGILEMGEDGKIRDTGVDPFMRSYPLIADVGIMGSMCSASKVCPMHCYQGRGTDYGKDMTLEDFKSLVDQMKNKTTQFALGGSGNPDDHADFYEILKYSRENGIIPNYTTSGIQLTEEKVAWTKEFCGAVAVSFHTHHVGSDPIPVMNDYTAKALSLFLDAGIKTNIHYVLGKNTIDDAIYRLKNNAFPEGINAVVFLLYKPVGLGIDKYVLTLDDPRVKEFFELIDGGNFPFKVGFDACNATAIINLTNKINLDSIDACEAGRYSTYITSDMKMLPCSFDNKDQRWAVDLKTHTVEEAWESEQFEDFRSSFKNRCPDCKDHRLCLSGCPIKREIVLCDRKERLS